MKHQAKFVLCTSIFRSGNASTPRLQLLPKLSEISLCKIQNIGSGYRWCWSQLTSSNDCRHIGIVINILTKLSRTGSLVHPFRPYLSNKLFNKRFWLLQPEIRIEKWRRGDLKYRDIHITFMILTSLLKIHQKRLPSSDSKAFRWRALLNLHFS
jgi:hypothetical protein